MSTTVIAQRAMRDMKKKMAAITTTLGAGVQGKVSAPRPRLPAVVSGRFAALRAHNVRDHDVEWFIVNLLDKSSGRPSPPQIYRSFKAHFFGVPSCATLGSTFYCLGGTNFGVPLGYHICNRSNQVSMLDANCPDHGFKMGPSMIAGRDNAFTVPIRGKLYVFGGASSIEYPFAECFDPKKNKWEPISEPPIANSLTLHPIFAIPYGKTDIMVSLMPTYCPNEKETVLIYHTESDSWELYPNPLSSDSCGDNPVKVGNTLYSIGGMFMYAYDLSSHQSYSGFIKGSVFPVMGYLPSCETSNQHLFHIGGNQFCFVELQYPSYEPQRSVFHCTKIRVVKKDSGKLNATTISVQSYLVDHRLEFIDGMPLDGRFVGSFLSKNLIIGSSSGEKHV